MFTPGCSERRPAVKSKKNLTPKAAPAAISPPIARSWERRWEAMRERSRLRQAANEQAEALYFGSPAVVSIIDVQHNKQLQIVKLTCGQLDALKAALEGR